MVNKRLVSGAAFLAIAIAGLAVSRFKSSVAEEKPAETASADEKGPREPERPKLYDTQADGSKQIAAALKRAKAERKHVLLKFGANWCGWCHKLSKCFKENEDVARLLNQNYVLVLIDVDIVDDQKHNADVLERYGNPTRLGLPALVVLDAEGEQLTTKDTAELEEDDHHDPQKVLAFLNEWQPEKPRPGRRTP
ncbi:MAG TPA: thioredoxin family protein [Pirellulales bacterium]|nr:thioredoxin family protein [Pirellulales bacterium]